MSEYSDKAPLEASSLVHFRKRLNVRLLAQVNELIIEQAHQDPSGETSTPDEDEDGDDTPPIPPSNQGKLVLG